MSELSRPDLDCTSQETAWSGNKRGILHPGQNVKNAGGPEQIWTTVRGEVLDGPQPGAVLQYIKAETWSTWVCCGPEAGFRISQGTEGLLVTPDPGAGYDEWGAGAVQWPN